MGLNVYIYDLFLYKLTVVSIFADCIATNVVHSSAMCVGMRKWTVSQHNYHTHSAVLYICVCGEEEMWACINL